MSDGASAGPRDDDSFLDRLLGEFLDELAAGRAIDVDAHAAARPGLRERIVEVLALAAEIALVQPAGRPRVAGHELLGELGRGAMGTVYLARQTALARRVALKVMSSRWAAGSRGRARFLREARAVARLRHDHIVPVHEVGESDGTPWFSMEWIDGRTLADGMARLRGLARPPAHLTAADLARALGIDAEAADESDRVGGTFVAAVVKLIEPLARALDHAHARQVIHRDVKPSNVLVRRDGRPLLVDFGLATVEDEAALSLSGGFLGTPHYASPEQARGHADVDGRSDVYSLGATLYELLTLRRPAEGATTQEVLRRVEREEPESPRALNPAVPRDLETVVRAALEKEPARRYLSAAAFGDDLARVLRGEPVAARPVGALGRASRFIQREPTLAASVALAALILVGTPTGLWWRQRERTEELRRTQAAVQTRARITGLVEEMFASLNPDRAKGRTVTVREVLDDAAHRLDHGLEGEPATEMELRSFVGRSFRSLGLVDAAERQFTRELALARGLNPGSPRAVAVAIAGLSGTAFDRADFKRSEALASEARALLEGANAAATPEMAEVLNDLAIARIAAGDVERAEPVYRDAIALMRRVGNENEVATCVANYGQLLVEAGRYSDAEDHLREALAIRRRLGDSEQLQVAFTLDFLADLYRDTDRFKDERPPLEEALAIEQKLLGNDDPWTIDSLAALASAVLRDEGAPAAGKLLGELEALRPALAGRESMVAAKALNEIALLEEQTDDLAAAEAGLRDALARFERLVGRDHAAPATVLQNLCRVLYKRGRYGEADACGRDSLARWRGLAGEHDLGRAATLLDLAWCCDARFAVGEGEQFARESLEVATRRLGADALRTCKSRDALAWLLHGRGANQEAEQLLRDNLERKQRKFGDANAEVAATLGFLGETVESMGRKGEAREFYEEAIDIERDRLRGEGLALATALHRLGRLLLLDRHADDALPPLEEALEIRRRMLGDGHLHLVDSLNTVGACHQALGDLDAAQPLFEEAEEVARRVLGAHHPDLAIALANLASIRTARGDPAAAESLLLESLAILRQSRGERGAETLAVVERLATLYRDTGRLEQASAYAALLSAAGRAAPAGH